MFAGTNEEAIVNIMGYRSVVQRQDICTMFKTMFGKVKYFFVFGVFLYGSRNVLKTFLFKQNNN